MTKEQQLINHPQRGSSITVDPIRSLDDLKEMKELVYPNRLYSCLLVLGINTNLRASDLVGLTVGQVRGLQPMSEITLREKKTGNHRRISLNTACIEAINRLLATRKHADDDILFTGQRGPLTVPSVSRLVKEWARKCGLRGNYGAHSLRKTWGYQQRNTFGVGLPELMKVFGHSSERQTLAYIGIQDETVKNIYANEL